MSVPIVPSQGPLTAADLRAVWESCVDESFSRSMIEKGDGSGIEAYDQSFEQLARLSRAVDETTQAMYILPWSGQTAEPAADARRAAVALTLARTGFANVPLVVTAGIVRFGEATTDWGEVPGESAQDVETGRFYALAATHCFPPGSLDAVTVQAEAEKPGWGYNNPLPGTLKAIEQLAANFANDGASVAPPLVVCANEPDTFVPDHVGQYVRFSAGANAGRIARVVGYLPPSAGNGGSLSVARDVAFDASTSGTYEPGEIVSQAGTGAVGRFLGKSATSVVLEWASGTFNGTGVLTGSFSGATSTPTAVSHDTGLLAESGTAAWAFVPWGAGGWGLSSTNQASPSGGRLGFLDELGRERNVRRGPGEGNDSYRHRVATPADVVSPGAISRAFNKILAPVGIEGCLREAGLSTLPGFYYDRPDGGDWYDMEAYVIDLAVTVPSFDFFEGELVTQTDPATGIISVGKAILAYQAAGLGDPAGRFLESIAAVNGTFVDSLPIFGTVSGASYTFPSTLSGGPDHDLRYRYYFSYEEMRAFFLVTLPKVNFGEFGFAWDAGPSNAYDSTPASTFFDGYPASQGNFYMTVWQAIDPIRAGGVGFDLQLDDEGCP